MKKIHIIIISIVTLIIISGIFASSYFLSLHNVDFIVKQNNLTIDIYKKADKTKINSFKSEKFSLSLSKGDYYYIINSVNFDNTEHIFSIDNSNIIITVDPNYSATYLAKLLSIEQDNILSVIKTAYPTIISSYTITNTTLFKKGEWCGAIIEKVINSRDIADPYRVILKKENNKWIMVHYPEIVVTKTNFPDVPVEVLTAVNNLTFS